MPQPKAHKYKRKQRLMKAKTWIKTYKGKKIHHGYAKYFGVNKVCAILELEMLEIEIPEHIKDGVKRSKEDKRIRTDKRKKEKEKEKEYLGEFGVDFDDHYAYIAGYTSGGAAFGITWEEMEEIKKREKMMEEGSCKEDELVEKIDLTEETEEVEDLETTFLLENTLNGKSYKVNMETVKVEIKSNNRSQKFSLNN